MVLSKLSLGKSKKLQWGVCEYAYLFFSLKAKDLYHWYKSNTIIYLAKDRNASGQPLDIVWTLWEQS